MGPELKFRIIISILIYFNKPKFSDSSLSGNVVTYCHGFLSRISIGELSHDMYGLGVFVFVSLVFGDRCTLLSTGQGRPSSCIYDTVCGP